VVVPGGRAAASVLQPEDGEAGTELFDAGAAAPAAIVELADDPEEPHAARLTMALATTTAITKKRRRG
jgi:hypothetical protein